MECECCYFRPAPHSIPKRVVYEIQSQPTQYQLKPGRIVDQYFGCLCGIGILDKRCDANRAEEYKQKYPHCGGREKYGFQHIHLAF